MLGMPVPHALSRDKPLRLAGHEIALRPMPGGIEPLLGTLALPIHRVPQVGIAIIKGQLQFKEGREAVEGLAGGENG